MNDDFAARLRDSVGADPVRSTLDPDRVLHRSLRTQTRRAFGTAGIAVATCAVMGTAIAVPGGIFDQTTEMNAANALLDGDVLRPGEQPVLTEVDGIVATDKAVGVELSDGTAVLDLGIESWAGTDERFVVTFPVDNQRFPHLEVWSADAAGLDQLFARGKADSAGLSGMTRISDNHGAEVVITDPERTRSVVVGGIRPADEVALVPWEGDDTVDPHVETEVSAEEFAQRYATIVDRSTVIPTVRDPHAFYDISVFAAELGDTPLFGVVDLHDGIGNGGYFCDTACPPVVLSDDGTVTRDEPDLETVLASAVWTHDLDSPALRVVGPSTHGVQLSAQCDAPAGVALEAVVSLDGDESSRTVLPCTGQVVEVELWDLVGDVTVELVGDLTDVSDASARLRG